jgi:superfamily II DNA or RNA helicase
MFMDFIVGQNYVQALKCSESDLSILKAYLRLPVANAWFRMKKMGRKWDPKKRKMVGWDGMVSFFSLTTRKVPIGLWPHLKRHLIENEVKFSVTNRRHRLPELTTRKLGSIELYDEQFDAANKWLRYGGSGIIWAAAGFGKTEVAAAVLNHLFDKKIIHRALFVVNGLDLLKQGADRLSKRLNVKVSSIDSWDQSSNVIVANIQQLVRRIQNKDHNLLQVLARMDILIYDETHHSRSDQTTVLMRYCPAKYRMGISARPFHTYDKNDLHTMKAEDAKVLSAIGPVVARVRASKLIEQGKLSRPKIFLYPVPSLSDRELPFPVARKKLIIKNRLIHDVTRQCVLAASQAGETTLVVAGGSLELGARIYMNLKDNFNVVNLHGGVEKDFREQSRQKMIKNKLDVAIASTIYDEGIDIPNLRQVILVYGGLSAIKNEQRLGRGLRTKKGQDKAVIIDFFHYGNKHLQKHSMARLKQYLEEDAYEIFLVTDRFPKNVITLAGKDRVVETLPTKALFTELATSKKGITSSNETATADGKTGV